MRYVILTDEEAEFVEATLHYQIHCVTEMTQEERDRATAIVRKLAQRS